MKKVLILLLLSSSCLASGPKYGHKDPLIADEFTNVYKDISNVFNGNVRASSMTISTLTVQNLHGKTDGSPACAGCIGEKLESVIGSLSGFTNGTWDDVTTITLTPGNWLIDGMVEFQQDTAVTRAIMGIGTASGTGSSGLVSGSTTFEASLPTASIDSTGSVAPFLKSVSVNTTMYLKVNIAEVTTRSIAGARITAIRIY